MIDAPYLETVVAGLRNYHNLEGLDAGLTDAEIRATQHRFGFIFPPDLRALLQFVLPIGKEFPDWRDGTEDQLRRRMDWPFEGIRFDVESNNYWLPAWGARPDEEDERLELMRRLVERAPRLIPICSHRYMPSDPPLAGNPVFSVYQTDIVYYGNDLADYFRREFKVPLPDWAAERPRVIRFWDEIR
jgi:hypothetical protein